MATDRVGDTSAADGANVSAAIAQGLVSCLRMKIS